MHKDEGIDMQEKISQILLQERKQHMMPIIAIHESTREYIYPVDRRRLRIRIRCSRENIRSCTIVYWNRFNDSVRKQSNLVCTGRDNDWIYFSGELSFEETARYIKYYFIISGNGKTWYLGRNGLSSVEPRYFFEYLYTNELDVLKVPEWARGSILYQIFPDRFFNKDKGNDPPGVVSWDSTPSRENFFGGDLKGIISRLDHISSLNVDVIYLTPIFKSPSNHKYDTEDYFSVDPSFGDMDDLRKLVRECHARNIRVILDGVFNHSGYFFPPFQDVIQNGEKSKYRDWFYIESFPVRTDPPNYECVGYYKWMPKLRFSNPDVRKYFIEVGTYWIKEADIDGWRLDVADEVDFTFWQEFRRAIKSVKKDALLIAETWKNGSDMLRGDQVDSVMNYLFRDAVVDYFATGAIHSLEFDNLIERMLHLYTADSLHVLYNLLGSHDTPRFLSLCNGNLNRMKLAIAFQMTFPGMPAIYYGDEAGMEGDNDPDCRRAFDWENINQDLLAFYRKMTALRKSDLPLRYGEYRGIHCDEGTYGFARSINGDNTYIILNNSAEEKALTIPCFESISEKSRFISLLDGKAYMPEEISDGETFLNSDIYDYCSKIKMILPAYHFEIIKKGG